MRVYKNSQMSVSQSKKLMDRIICNVLLQRYKKVTGISALVFGEGTKHVSWPHEAKLWGQDVMMSLPAFLWQNLKSAANTYSWEV